MKTNSVPQTFRKLMTVGLAIGSLAGPLLAQTPSPSPAPDEPKSQDSDTVKLNPFTVSETQRSPWNSQQTFSGSRVAENIMDVPINISIITSDFIQSVGATNLTDVLNYAGSGVNQRVSYRDDVSIRGFREQLNRDGIAYIGYGNPGYYDVDRIEVIKGPTALVYGNFSSIGGTVNYVTKRPTATSQGESHFSVGSDSFYSADVTQRGPVTQDGRVRYRVTLGGQNYGGYKNEEYENIKAYSGSVDWTVTKEIEMHFDYAHGDNVRRDFNRSLVDPVALTLAPLPADFSTSAPWSKVQSSNDRYRVEAIYQPTKNVTARILGNSFENDYGYQIPQPAGGLNPAQYPNYTSIGQRFLSFALKDKKQDVQADITWKVDIGDVANNRLTAGWANVYTSTVQNLLLAPMPDLQISTPFDQRPGIPPKSTWVYLLDNSVSRSTGWTAYVQDAVTLFHDHLILVAGVRDVPEGATSKGVSTTLPRYGIVYKVNDGLSLYSGYSKSFSPLSGVDLLGTPYRDIYGEDKEVGIKVNSFGGRLFGSVAYFDILNDPVVTQVQVVDPRTGILVFGNQQTGKQTNKGVEVDMGTQLDLGPGQLLGFATYYNADPKDETGMKPARAVSTKMTLFMRYEFKTGPVKGFSIGAGRSEFGSQIGTGIPLEPGYTLYSATLGYTKKNWSVIVNFDNVTNVKDAILGSEANFSVNTERPFSTKVSFAYHW
ncbi:MAG: TonB-dependent siderophore receptor [Verrucomicrobia bacterium]|nr:TonB-dependent siderophore receptor [Verrucomicrobiota bacterium]